MPFKKGQSGNPGGRPKGVGDLRDIARQHTGEAVEVLIEIMGNTKAAPSARVGAATALLDRGWGRPAQEINVNPNKNLEPDPIFLRSMGEILDEIVAKNKAETDAKKVLNGEAEAKPSTEIQRSPPNGLAH